MGEHSNAGKMDQPLSSGECMLHALLIMLLSTVNTLPFQIAVQTFGCLVTSISDKITFALFEERHFISDLLQGMPLIRLRKAFDSHQDYVLGHIAAHTYSRV